ncbi:MAG TPA: cytochrome B6, partial [Candidatus Marinimicrobia bacterium]|nr:cytochrome B6 [Candidatus Neomarinimicrobiota bacterium]
MSDKKNIFERFGDSQVWKSIIRSGVPRTRRQRMMSVLNSVFLHLHPVRLPRHAVKLKFTWCMGGLTFFLFLVLTISGILLMFYYRPTVEYAYTDM